MSLELTCVGGSAGNGQPGLYESPDGVDCVAGSPVYASVVAEVLFVQSALQQAVTSPGDS